jgi:DNA-binding NarL/FixJ family response regulator
MSKIRVLLADDHPIVRSGIRPLLEKQPDIEVVGEAATGEEALRLVAQEQPDVMVLDMELPDMPGLTVMERLQAVQSHVRVLVLSAYDERQYIINTLSHGAAGYLVKEEAPKTIVDAIRGVGRGESGWLSRQVAARMADWTRDQGRIGLTPRELSVLRLVVLGKTNVEIGAELHVSEKTVEKHLQSVFEKLGVSSRVEAAVRAVQEGLV